MENASKALLMAGGILLALILLTAFVYLFGQVSQNAKEQDRLQQMEQINEFNAQYEAYQRNLLIGVDIASVCNKANSNNIKNQNKDINEEIHIYVTFMEGWEEFNKKTKYDMTTYDFDGMKKNNSDKFYSFKTKYFKCTKVEYNSDTGKVKALYFTEIDGIALLRNEVES